MDHHFVSDNVPVRFECRGSAANCQQMRPRDDARATDCCLMSVAEKFVSLSLFRPLADVHEQKLTVQEGRDCEAGHAWRNFSRNGTGNEAEG